MRHKSPKAVRVFSELCLEGRRKLSLSHRDAGEIKRREVELDSHENIGEIKRREVELDLTRT